MKVFIIGHGEMIRNIENAAILPVHFYIIEYERLTDQYIPGIIQIETRMIQNIPLNDFFANANISDRENHGERHNCNVEHGLFTVNENDPYMCKLYHLLNNVNVDNDIYAQIWNFTNILDNYTQYSLKRNIIIQNNVLNVHTLNRNQKHVIYNHFKTINDAILLLPQDNIEYTDPILLSSIIEACNARFNHCEFYWLACRECIL